MADHATAGMSLLGLADAPAGEFLSVQDEGRAFWRMRWRIVRTTLRQLVLQSRFRLTLVVGLSALLWVGLFWLLADGFGFLKTAIPHPETRDETVRAVFGMFFAALMVMLVFSSGVILYGSLFCSRDTAFLLTIPARTERVFLHKFQEAVLLSSWGFLLLGSPMLLAYGIVAGAPWYYYAMLPPFVVAFVYAPASLGAILCLEVVYHLPKNRLQVVVLAGALLLAGGIWMVGSLIIGPEKDLLTPGWFQEMLRRLQFSQGRLLPSWWLSTGLLEAARDVWSESVLFLVLLIANALMSREVTIWIAARLYRPAYSGLDGGQRGPRRIWPAGIDRLVVWGSARLAAIVSALAAGVSRIARAIDRAAFHAAGVLPLPMRLMIVKDLRIFRRDPVQWSQFLIFFALLMLYFVNIRRFRYDMYYVGWVQMVSFLNLSVVGLLMSTFTTRFIFPMISLEGRRFWLLGLLPLRRETILWSKFAFAVGGSILPCSLLILLSDGMLHVSPLVLASHQLTCWVLCLGLSGIAVGLGARFPNLREQSPARIAAGFGGTLNLVISTLYILVVVLLTALPCHFYLAASTSPAAASLNVAGNFTQGLQLWLIIGTCGSVLLGALATVIPLRVGFRAFRQLEF